MISGFTQEYLNLIANNIGRQCKGQLDGQLLASQHKGEGFGLADAGDAGQEEDGPFVVARRSAAL